MKWVTHWVTSMSWESRPLWARAYIAWVRVSSSRLIDKPYPSSCSDHLGTSSPILTRRLLSSPEFGRPPFRQPPPPCGSTGIGENARENFARDLGEPGVMPPAASLLLSGFAWSAPSRCRSREPCHPIHEHRDHRWRALRIDPRGHHEALAVRRDSIVMREVVLADARLEQRRRG